MNHNPDSPPSNPLDDFHIVLVEPANSLNVGMVTRAMMNLGFRHLHLVAPVNYDPDRATVTAISAAPLLETLHIHDTLAEAVADREEVVGLALRPGKNPSHFATLPQWAATLSERAAPASPHRTTALVFGPEDNGLRQEHLNLCRWVVRIPSTAAFESFNLAQSVLLTLYEIAEALSSPTEGTVHAPLPTPPQWAPRRDYLLLDRLVESVMRGSGFVLRGPQPPSAGAVRNLFGRLELTIQEMGILLSLFGRIDYALRRNAPSPPSPDDKSNE